MILSRRSFLKLAGLTTVAAASASMFTGCGSLKPITIVYTYAEDASEEVKKAAAALNNDKSKTVYIALMSDKNYTMSYVNQYVSTQPAVVIDNENTTFKVATEGENKGKLVICLKAKPQQAAQ